MEFLRLFLRLYFAAVFSGYLELHPRVAGECEYNKVSLNENFLFFLIPFWIKWEWGVILLKSIYKREYKPERRSVGDA